ncbi:WSC domain protein [Apiospora marii]|uniref:WSC domain protein n=1 Tax=Apiospora marii TaxID=335849 RepID=A0ABR1RQ69_9PEZI
MQFSAALALVGAFSVAQAYSFVGCSATAVSSVSKTDMFMSFGLCEDFCKKEACGAPTVMALSGNLCHCGKMPDQNDLVDEALCNTPCPGYGMDSCGGPNTFSIFSI